MLNPAVKKLLEQGFEKHQAHELTEAIKIYQQVLDLDPEAVDAWRLMGIALRTGGAYDAAINILTHADNSFDDQTEIQTELALTYLDAGQPDKAIDLFQKQLEENPKANLPDYYLGRYYLAARDLNKAVYHLSQATKRNQYMHEAWLALTEALTMGGLEDEAKAAAVFTYALNEDALGSICALNWKCDIIPYLQEHRAGTLKMLVARASGGHFNSSTYKMFQRMMAADPDALADIPEAIEILLQACDWQYYDRSIDHIKKLVNQRVAEGGPLPIHFTNMPLLTDDPVLLAKAAKRCSDKIEDQVRKYRDGLNIPPRDLTQEAKKKRIKICYAMPYTRNGSMTDLVRSILELQDRDRFEVIGFNLEQLRLNTYAKELEELFDRCYSFYETPLEEVAEVLLKEEIDIMIDTTGHTFQNCQPIMALKLVPVQLHYFGFVDTIGPYMDYLIGDPICTAPDIAKHFSEKIITLPDSIMISTSAIRIGQSKFSRADFELPEDAFIFACFNHARKLEPHVWDAWCEILRQTPGSLLWLGLFTNENAPINNILKETEKRGVDPKRIIQAPLMLRHDHIHRLQLADLALDPFMQSSGGNGIDSMRASLPMLTRKPTTTHNAGASSIMNAAGLGDLICDNTESYIAKAVALATTERDTLEQYKKKLTAMTPSHPLRNLDLYVKHLERGFEMAWQNYLDGNPPQNLTVERD